MFSLNKAGKLSDDESASLEVVKRECIAFDGIFESTKVIEDDDYVDGSFEDWLKQNDSVSRIG